MTTEKTVSTLSKQDYTTPRWFIDLVSERWPLGFDLAASRDNFRFPAYFTEADNALILDWKLVQQDNKYHWLNPPFKQVAPWVKKCAEESAKGCRIVTLTKASRGARWYRNWVQPYALSLILGSRIAFEGQKYKFTQDLMLNIYGDGITGQGYWDFKQEAEND